ncbi:MAG: hypothetical protein AAF734_12905, partial [Bacteroidota bacterium]
FLYVLLVFTIQLTAQENTNYTYPTATESTINAFDVSRQLVDGDLAIRSARWEDAILAYDNVIVQWPNWAPAYVKRGMVKLRMGRTTEAQQDLNYAKRLSLNSVKLFTEYNYADRLDLLVSEQLEGTPQVSDTVLDDLNSMKRSGQFGAAVAELEYLWSSGKIDDGTFALLNGNMYLLLNDYATALRYYDQALRNSADATIYHNIGLAQILRYNFSEGCENLLRAGQEGHTPALDQWSDLCTF